MQSRVIDYVTSNEDDVRLRIFDGDLQISEAAQELLHLERSQHEATRRELAALRSAFEAEIGALKAQIINR